MNRRVGFQCAGGGEMQIRNGAAVLADLHVHTECQGPKRCILGSNSLQPN